MKYDVSIVVLAYNQEKYIAQTMESIIKQDTDYLFEIIVADDKSNDKTPEIIKSFEEKYDFIHAIYNDKNMGVINNYINALDFCSSDYIMECGGDDCWPVNKIERQLLFMKSHPEIGISYGLAKIMDESGCVTNKLIGDSKSSTYEGLILGNNICASSVCFKKVLWKQYLEDTNIVEKKWKMEDYPFWIWLSINSKLSFINEILAYYRILDNSITHQKDINKQIEFEKSVYEVKKYYVSESEKDLIYSIHCANLAQIYYSYNDIGNYRLMLKKSKRTKDRIKWILSYLPFSIKIRKLRRSFIGNE